VRRRLLVTGGSGFLGSRVARQGAAAGWEVVATSRRTDGVDITRLDDVRCLMRDFAPHSVVHTAYVKDVDEVTVGGSAEVAGASAEVGARLVHVSSDVVFSGLAARPYLEGDIPDPVNDYGRAKVEAERLVQVAHPNVVVVRTSLLLGGPDDPGVHEVHALAVGAPFWSDVVRCPVMADDVAAALLELVDLPVRGPLHVAGPQSFSRVELASLVRSRPARGELAPPGQPLDVRLDSTRAHGLLRTRLRGPREVWGSA